MEILPNEKNNVNILLSLESILFDSMNPSQQEIYKTFKNFDFLKFIPVHTQFSNLKITDSLVYSFYYYWSYSTERPYPYPATYTAKALGLSNRQFIYRINKQLEKNYLINERNYGWQEIGLGVQENDDEEYTQINIPKKNYIKIPSIILPLQYPTKFKLLIGELWTHSLYNVYPNTISELAKKIECQRSTLIKYLNELNDMNLINYTKGKIKLLINSKVTHYFKYKEKLWKNVPSLNVDQKLKLMDCQN